jgi:hypothetical protein
MIHFCRHEQELCIQCRLFSGDKATKSRWGMRWVEHATRMGEIKGADNAVIGIPLKEIQLGRSWHRREVSI